ncbi:MAG TPA: hypothetical protein VK558_17860 [Patescibacteria group bacterium]|nr:hypothetical protein [Patescibacteria group bacterium]
MADVLAFVLPVRPRDAAVRTPARTDDRRVTGAFRWFRESTTGTLVCRWDAEPAEADSPPVLLSA